MKRYKKFDGYIQQLLEPYGVWKQGDDDYRSRCPIHGGGNPSSFHISSWGRWRCYACGASGGDLESLLMAWHKLSFSRARDVLGSVPSRFASVEELQRLPPFDKRHRPRKGPEKVVREADIVLHKKNCPRLLLNRGFSLSALRTYEIGYDTADRVITIPVRDVDGRLVGLTKREDYEGSLKFKGRNIKYFHDGFNKTEHLWGLHLLVGRKPVEKLFLVEGQLDVVRLHQLGKPAVAILGSEIDRKQIALLQKRSEINRLVLMFDNDDAGHKATNDAIKKLSKTRFGAKLQIARYSTDDPGGLEVHHVIQLIHWTQYVVEKVKKHGFEKRSKSSSRG